MPDYVFDEGERHPKPTAVKRPKGSKVSDVLVHTLITINGLNFFLRVTVKQMTSLKISRTKSRKSEKAYTIPQRSAGSSLSRSPITPTDSLSLKSQNPLATVTASVRNAVVEAPPPGASIYASTVTNPADIKSPRLPFGENAAVAGTVQ